MKPNYQTARLAAGRHPSPSLGACVMELASMLAAEKFSDRPATVSPVIAAFLRTYNDGVNDERRQDLYALAALIIGTAGSRRAERERASRCLDFARRLEVGPPTGRAALGALTPEASGSWAAMAALRGGRSPTTHEAALTFVRELALLKPASRRKPWRLGRDPGQAVEDALAIASPPPPTPPSATPPAPQEREISLV